MCSTPAEIAGEAVLDLLFRRAWIRTKQRGRGHYHTVGTVSALRRLFRDECCLDRVGSFGCSQAFNCRYGATGNLLHGCDAGSDGLAVEQNRAGPALAEAASELRAVQPKRVSQNIEQRLIGIPRIDRGGLPVYLKLIGGH